MKQRILFFTMTLSMLVLDSTAQSINQVDKRGRRKGKWIVYSDSLNKIKLTEGNYRKGNSVGRFYYYTPEGILERREIIRLNRLFTQTYYPDGSLRSKGKARIEHLPDRVHYYYYGKWNYYDSNHTLYKYSYFKKGKKVKTIYIKKDQDNFDSLKTALLALDLRFKEQNKDLLDSIVYSAFNIKRREQFQFDLYVRDTSFFYQVAFLVSKYGYPPKEKVQEGAEIPFYIMSYAPVPVRESFLPVLKKAADAGDISWKSLSFYIDKLQLAKGEKQIYGTQYYYRSDQQIVYPVIDPENLEKRRVEAGW